MSVDYLKTSMEKIVKNSKLFSSVNKPHRENNDEYEQNIDKPNKEKNFSILEKDEQYHSENSKYSTLTLSKKFEEDIVRNLDDVSLRVDRYITKKFNLKWDTIHKYFRNNEIFLIRNGLKIKNPGEKLYIYDKIYISKKILEKIEPLPEKSQITEKKNNKSKLDPKKLDIMTERILEDIFNSMVVFKSNEFFVINKFTNLACQDGSYLKFSLDTILELMNFRNNLNLKLVHRLDRSVSGLMLLANDMKTVRKLGELIRNSRVKKNYITLAQNIPLFIKRLYEQNKFDFNDSNQLISLMEGYIKSTEDCDQFIIENDRSAILYDSFTNNFKLTKLGHAFLKMEQQDKKSIRSEEENNNSSYNNTNNWEEFDSKYLSGKFRISSFIFYNQEKKQFKCFKMTKESILTMNYDDMSSLKDYLYKYFEGKKIECYTIYVYELVSGKKHQIRKHMSRCFFTPIFNDVDYMFDPILSPQVMKMFMNSSQDNNKNTESGEERGKY